MDLRGPGSGCDHQASAGECLGFLGGGVEDSHGGEGAGWGAGDGGGFGGLVEMDVAGLAAFHEEAAEE